VSSGCRRQAGSLVRNGLDSLGNSLVADLLAQFVQSGLEIVVADRACFGATEQLFGAERRNRRLVVTLIKYNSACLE